MYTVHNLRMELKCEDLVLLPRLWQTFDSKRLCGGFKFDSKLFMEILTNEVCIGLLRQLLYPHSSQSEPGAQAMPTDTEFLLNKAT